ncbi:putative transporter [Thozetella sp. PMI_491]|nr:putative transporter [Thozetella sp. PMI_491]
MPLVDSKTAAETPKGVISLKIVLFCALLSFSGALHGFNTANISGVLAMPTFAKKFGLDQMDSSAVADWSGWITSMLILGSCAGALVTAIVGDWLGRRYGLAASSAIFCVSAVLMTANPGGEAGRVEFLVGRFLSGFGSGAASVIGTGYIAEIAPKAIRGGLSALYNANTMLCVGLAYWINYGALSNIAGDAEWQVPMAVQALPGVILLAGLFFIPNSPRWLASKGKASKSLESLSRLRSLSPEHSFVDREFREIQHGVEQMSEIGAGGARTIIREIFSPSIRKRMIMVMIIQVGFQFSGGNIITYYNTPILTSIGLGSKSTSYIFAGIYGIVKFVAVCFYCLFVVDRFGRRSALFAGSAGIIASLLYLTIYLAVSTPSSTLSGGTSGAGWAAVVAIYIFAIAYAVSWGTIPWLINAEVFPTRIRSVCMSICVTWQYLVNFALTRGQPNMVIAMHPWGPFLLFACFTTLMTVYCFFAYPETRGMSMEDMDELFAMPWYKVGRASVQIVSKQNGSHHEEYAQDGKGGENKEHEITVNYCEGKKLSV